MRSKIGTCRCITHNCTNARCHSRMWRVVQCSNAYKACFCTTINCAMLFPKGTMPCYLHPDQSCNSLESGFQSICNTQLLGQHYSPNPISPSDEYCHNDSCSPAYAHKGSSLLMGVICRWSSQWHVGVESEMKTLQMMAEVTLGSVEANICATCCHICIFHHFSITWRLSPSMNGMYGFVLVLCFSLKQIEENRW